MICARAPWYWPFHRWMLFRSGFNPYRLIRSSAGQLYNRCELCGVVELHPATRRQYAESK